MHMEERAIPLVFSIIGGNKDSAFQIDAFGKVETAQELDAEIETFYQLKISVTTNNQQIEGQILENISIQTQLEVYLLNINDNAPFIPSLPKIQLYEGIKNFMNL